MRRRKYDTVAIELCVMIVNHRRHHHDEFESSSASTTDDHHERRVAWSMTTTLSRWVGRRLALLLIGVAVFAVVGVYMRNSLSLKIYQSSTSSSSSSMLRRLDSTGEPAAVRPTFELNRDRYFWFRNDSFVVRTDSAAAERRTLLFSGSIHYFRFSHLLERNEENLVCEPQNVRCFCSGCIRRCGEID
jgi:hypothetical protein